MYKLVMLMKTKVAKKCHHKCQAQISDTKTDNEEKT